MKGKIVNVMRKWWLMALMLTLALSLTSCAKRKLYNQNSNYGFSQCDSTNWQFDVYLFKSTTKVGYYDIVIMPAYIDTPGDIATVTIANNQNGGYRQLINQVVLYANQEIDAGSISNADLNSYPILAITSFDATTNWAQATPAKASYCYLPIPGDGTSY